MPSEEGTQILRLLAEGKIDVDQAYRLLRALGDIDERTRGGGASAPPRPDADRLWRPDKSVPPGLRGRILRIEVRSAGSSKVNIAIPLAIARMGKMKLGAAGMVREHLAKFGIDLDEVMREIKHYGPIVDITDGEDRVYIGVE